MNEKNQKIVTNEPLGRCKECGHYVYPSDELIFENFPEMSCPDVYECSHCGHPSGSWELF